MGGDLDQESIFYVETLEKEDMGELHQTLLCQGPVEFTSGRKRNKRYLSLFNDALVVSSNLLKEQKDRWYYFLKRYFTSYVLMKAKMGIKKNFSLEIFTEDIPTCDNPLCVTATDINTVNDITEKLLPIIRMPNSEDYQLWFCPGHEEAPRALEGCENPHDIIMANLQNNCNRLNSKIFTAFPALPGLFVKDLNSNVQGQFILKP
ncbi:rho GTPase-activating protein 20-like [Mastomys coucha]|uniref:rho GTPase-activating protein 20-like n=1 Tax=Mastomys coucha TaxID=35658 RepID=UPI0012628538|nr:rho GTPase-activating protein 20-like [Mastomys coucha]